MTIKELRSQTGLTQQAMSDLLHIPKRTIENWEAGSREPPQYVIDLTKYYFEHENLINKAPTD